MKNFNLLGILFSLLSATAFSQSPIIPLTTNQSTTIPGAYYKDVDGNLDQFVGTWRIINGATELELIIEKKTLYYNTLNNIYEDMLIGEYKYIENGILKINTLNLISNPPADLYSHNINGNIILAHDNFPVCDDCLFEKRVALIFSDPTRSSDNGLWGELELRRMDDGNVQKIKATLRQKGNIISLENEPPAYTGFNVPFGTYILTRVP